MKDRQKILIVDDKKENLIALERILRETNAEIIKATSGNDAIIASLNYEFALAILDVQMPDMNGYEAAELILQEEKNTRLPIIFTSAIYKEDFHQVTGIEVGAVDFITKPFIPEILVGKVRVFLDLHKHRLSLENEIKLRKQSEEALKESEVKLREINDELRQSLAKLEISEERFRSLVVTVPDIVYRINPQGKFTFINDAITRLGYTPPEVIGKHFSEIVHSTDIERVSRQKVLAKYKGRITGDEKSPKLFDERRTGPRKTTGLEVRLLTKSKKLVPGLIVSTGKEDVTVEINSAGMYEVEQSTKKNKFVGTVGVIRDITERKRIEGKVLRQGALLDGINRVFLEALRCESEEEVAKTCLEVAEELTGSKFGFISEANQLGRYDTLALSNPGWDLCEIKKSDAAEMLRDMEPHGYGQKTAIEGQSQIVNDPASHPERGGMPEGHPPLTSFLGIPLKKGNEAFGMIALGNKEGGYDVSDQQAVEALSVAFVEALSRKRAELSLKKHEEHLTELVEMRTAELRESQTQLIEAEKVGALGTLTAGIAHELNNPMMGMLNFTQYCLKHTAADDKRYGVLKDTEYETKRCIEIVKNLLTFSRLEEEGEEKYETESITTIFDRVFRLLAYRIEKENVLVTKDIAEDVPKISMKVSNLQQVFLNLVGNALDALKEREDKKLLIGMHPVDGSVEVTVDDNGCGIAPENLQRIFDPFFTTKPPGQGTGLGLSVCRSIIKAHGGDIRCRSEIDAGTRFKVSLPIMQPRGAEEV